MSCYLRGVVWGTDIVFMCIDVVYISRMGGKIYGAGYGRDCWNVAS